MMKKKMMLLIALTVSLSAFAGQSKKILVCQGDGNDRIGFSTAPSETANFYTSSDSENDLDVIQQKNISHTIGVKYDSATGSFTAEGEKACTQYVYETQRNSKGETMLFETEIDDSTGERKPDSTVYRCRWTILASSKNASRIRK